jgi:hypothetical protein
MSRGSKGMLMAHDNSSSDKFMRMHEKTYSGFKSMILWAIAGIAIILLGLLAFAYN